MEKHIFLAYIAKKSCKTGLVIVIFFTRGTHITSDICSPNRETHISSDMFSPSYKTHMPSDMCSPTEETNSPGLDSLKTKEGKMAIFGPKPWINPYFLTSWTFCFERLERRFFELEFNKRHFPGLYCLKKKLGKWPILDQNHGLTPFEKCQFFDILNFLLL